MGVDWFEIISENFIDNYGYPAHVLDRIAAHRLVVMHGVSLSIGSTDPLDLVYLRKLRELAEHVRPVWISDHLCWTGINGVNSHDLLPMPLTRQSLAHVADRVRAVQDFLGRPLILENPSTYLEFRASDIPEWEYLRLLAEQTGCGLLLDVNNVYVSATNNGFDMTTYVEAVPADSIVQVHLAGCTDCGMHMIDTHNQPVTGSGRSIRWCSKKPAASPRCWNGTPIFRHFPSSWRNSPRPKRCVPVFLPMRRRRMRWRAGRSPIRWIFSSAPAMADADLGVLQRWMLSAVTTPGVREVLRVAREAYALDIGDAVKGSNRLSAPARLEIYARGYVLRLLECLRAEFPIFLALIGDQVFEMFASSYVWSRPSRSPSLYALGAGFADFLQSTRPDSGATPGAIEAIPANLAALERARADSYRARGLEGDPAHHAADAITLMISGASLRLPETARLLSLEFDFTEAIEAVRRGDKPAVPAAKPTCYAVARSRYRVHTHVLEPWQLAFLGACGAQGSPAQDACAAAQTVAGCDAAEIWAKLLLWMPAALDAGLVTMTK